MQMWPQPLLQHFWPQGHSSSKLQRSKHVPQATLGMGHTPTLPARQNMCYRTPTCGHPSMGHPPVGPAALGTLRFPDT